jgi:heme exporter protein D
LQRRSDYWGLVAWGFIILVLGFTFTKHFWFDILSPDNKALFWTNAFVAIGTLALAVVTVVSLFQTRAVISGEDRRQQQGFAPLLTLGDHFNSNEEYQPGYTLYNIGKGVALQISVRVTGEATTTTYDLPPGATFFPTEEERKAFFKQREVTKTTEVDDSYDCSALTDGGSTFFVQQFFVDSFPIITNIQYSKCSILYSDMFGNHYSTVYDDDRLGKYRWIQPKNLRIPKQQTETNQR